MTLERKTPKARKEARSYCRRCLAVMLCCVLVFGLTVRVTPRAQANAAVGVAGLIGVSGEGAAATGALATNPVGASLGLLLLVGAGVPIAAGYVGNEDSIFYGTKGYEIGAACWDYLYSLGGDIADWYMSTGATYEEKGGIAPGDSLTVPANVAEAVRQWAVSNIDFTDGTATYTQSGIYTDSGFLTFSQFPLGAVYGEMYYYADYGTVISCPPAGQILSYRFEDKNGTIFRYDFYLNSKGQFQVDQYKNEVLELGQQWAATSSFSFVLAPERATSPRYLAIRPSGINLSTGAYYEVQYLSGNRSSSDLFMLEENMPLDTAIDVPTTLTKTPALDQAKTQDMVVTVPADIPTTQVGDVSIPVVGTLTGEDLLDGAGTGEEDKPVPDVTPWDKILDGLAGIEGKVGSLPQDIADAVTAAAPWDRVLEGLESIDNHVGSLPLDRILEGLDGIGTQVGTLPQDIAGAITDALPITGSMVGDQTIAETMSNPDDLSGAFISKFPFCIPWDIVQAIKLLAAPPVTPRWEIDLYGPLQGKWGFHADTTSIVIDLTPLEPAAVVTRWVSTIMFLYGLASATKRYIWTA